MPDAVSSNIKISIRTGELSIKASEFISNKLGLNVDPEVNFPEVGRFFILTSLINMPQYNF
jgi:hypothetical protein